MKYHYYNSCTTCVSVSNIALKYLGVEQPHSEMERINSEICPGSWMEGFIPTPGLQPLK